MTTPLNEAGNEDRAYLSRKIFELTHSCEHHPSRESKHRFIMEIVNKALDAKDRLIEEARVESAGKTIRIARGEGIVGEKVVYVTQEWLDQIEAENRELKGRLDKAYEELGRGDFKLD